MNEKNDYIVPIDDYEDQCECIRVHTAYVYTYPFVAEVAKTGAKIVTRDGRVVKKIRMGGINGVDVVVGILDGEELRWDAGGRFEGPYKKSQNDLRIFERYFYKNWKEFMNMSYAEWTIRFGRPHPTVKIPNKDKIVN